MNYRHIVFDMDGVILDSVPLKMKAFREWVSPFGPEVERAFMEFHRRSYGISRRIQIRHGLEEMVHPGRSTTEEELDAEVARFTDINARMAGAAPLRDGARSLLEALTQSGRELSIMTGTPTDEAEQLMGRHGLSDHFKTIQGSPTKKAVGIRTVIEGMSPDEAVCFVGDATADARAADEAGVPFFYIASDAHFEWEGPYTTLAELMDLLAHV